MRLKQSNLARRLLNQSDDSFSKLTIICVSEKWTKEMDYNLNKTSRLKVRFVWVSLKNQYVKDSTNKQRATFSKFVRHIEYKYEYGEQFDKPLLLF